MQTRLKASILATDAGSEANDILRSCVQCGFCTATCPTYQLTGDELDGPRGRIWLMKEMLERDAAGPTTQKHLDRCLGCRACETTCPSGVRYGRLLEIGREHLEARVPRSRADRLLRRLLLAFVPWPHRFRPILRAGQWFRPLLPRRLREKVPALQRVPSASASLPDQRQYSRQVILLAGCVQSLATPVTNQATRRVLNRLGIGGLEARGAVCCGALPQHLSVPETAREMARRNVDAWWPLLEAGASRLVMTASGCGVHVKDYGHVLAGDPDYAVRGAKIAALTVDLAEFLDQEDLGDWRLPEVLQVAWHSPCTLQHGQQVTGTVERLLDGIGCRRVPVADAHLCCGSAGTYSILQEDMSTALRNAKLAALEAASPEVIVTANIGCQMQLAGAAGVPVQHWVELLEAAAPVASRR